MRMRNDGGASEDAAVVLMIASGGVFLFERHIRWFIRPLKRADGARFGLHPQACARGYRLLPATRAVMASLCWRCSENCFDCPRLGHVASGHWRSLIPRGNSERPEVERCG